MKIIYSGLDTVIFAVKGALNPSALQHLELYRDKAIQEQRDVRIDFEKSGISGVISPKGAKGGYKYNIRFDGELGSIITIKENLNRNEWNGHIKIGALCLALHGWETAFDMALTHLRGIGFSDYGISFNRVDYAIDFLNAGIELSPHNFFAHSRVKKTGHKVDVNMHLRGHICESVTIGKMPSRQVIIYDKRREAIDKRKPAWFKIWGIDPHDNTLTVHRAEIRLGKKKLTQHNIRTLEDFKAKINAAMSLATEAIRFVTPLDTDQNTSRWPNHALWDYVQSHVKEHLLKPVNPVPLDEVKTVLRDQKALESKRLILGNMANYSVFSEMQPETMKQEIIKFIEDEFNRIECTPNHPFWQSRVKTQARYIFLDSPINGGEMGS